MLALLYDVHGNLPALEAVLADCPAEQFVLGGDYASFGAWPVETVERLRELDAEWIRGNVDRWLADARRSFHTDGRPLGRPGPLQPAARRPLAARCARRRP